MAWHAAAGGGMAEHHEYRLHADRAEDDVRGRDAKGHEQVVALRVFGRHHPVVDLVGLMDLALQIALVLDLAAR